MLGPPGRPVDQPAVAARSPRAHANSAATSPHCSTAISRNSRGREFARPVQPQSYVEESSKSANGSPIAAANRLPSRQRSIAEERPCFKSVVPYMFYDGGDIWSLCEMLEFAASRLFGVADFISTWAISLAIENIEIRDEIVWQNTRNQIGRAAEFCDDIGLSVSAAGLRQLQPQFTPDIETWPHEQRLLFREVRSRMQIELANRKLVMIAPERVRYYEDTLARFGDRVAAKLPRALEDIEDAGKCLAVEQGTACVFHLMRAMEIAVQRLARRLRVKIDPSKDTWDQIVGSINGAVRQMPRKTAIQRNRHAKITAAAAHLHTVRIAWRNEVMHPKQTYTVEEATRILDAVEGFMRDLVEFI